MLQKQTPSTKPYAYNRSQGNVNSSCGNKTINACITTIRINTISTLIIVHNLPLINIDETRHKLSSTLKNQIIYRNKKSNNQTHVIFVEKRREKGCTFRVNFLLPAITVAKRVTHRRITAFPFTRCICFADPRRKHGSLRFIRRV